MEIVTFLSAIAFAIGVRCHITGTVVPIPSIGAHFSLNAATVCNPPDIIPIHVYENFLLRRTELEYYSRDIALGK